MSRLQGYIEAARTFSDVALTDDQIAREYNDSYGTSITAYDVATEASLNEYVVVRAHDKH